MGLVAWRFPLWLLRRGHSLGHVHSFSDCQEWSWYYLWALLPRSYPWVRVTYYCSVSVWLQVVLKPLVPVRLPPCVDGSVCSLGNAFKSAPHPALIAPEWVQPCTCTLPSWSSQLIMMPGGLFWALSLVLSLKLLAALLVWCIIKLPACSQWLFIKICFVHP